MMFSRELFEHFPVLTERQHRYEDDRRNQNSGRRRTVSAQDRKQQRDHERTFDARVAEESHTTDLDVYPAEDERHDGDECRNR